MTHERDTKDKQSQMHAWRRARHVNAGVRGVERRCVCDFAMIRTVWCMFPLCCSPATTLNIKMALRQKLKQGLILSLTGGSF